MGLDMKFGIGKILVIVGAVMIFVCTFLPWFTSEATFGGETVSASVNAWDDGIGLFLYREDLGEDSIFWFGAIFFILLTIAALACAFIGPAKIVLIILGALATIFYAVNAFIGTPSNSIDLGALGKSSYGAGIGLYIGLISGIILLVGAILIKKADGASAAAAAPPGAPAPEQGPAPGSYEAMYGSPPPQQPPQTPPPY